MANLKNRTPKKTRKSDYTFVAENVYQSNDSYRVRVTVNGERYSKNFTSERKAIQWRNAVKRNGCPE